MTDREFAQVVDVIAELVRISPALVRRVIESGEMGVIPIRQRGSQQWDIWIAYQAIVNYERKRIE